MYFHPVTITGLDNKYKGTAESATLSGSTLTAFATNPSLPTPPAGQYQISGPNNVPSLIGTLESALPAMAVFNKVHSA